MSRLKKLWVREAVKSMKLRFPEKSEDELYRQVLKIYKERFQDNKVVIYNNYENQLTDTTLGGMVDWFDDKHPLICESGVYFKQKSEQDNINAKIIRFSMLDRRTELKKEMFRLKEAGDVFGANVKDLQQANTKKAANSGYGAEAEKTSFLYNLHSAMSVTSCGRGQLSTACQTIDNLLADFVKFMNMDEFYTYVNHIISEEPEWKFETFTVIDKIPSKQKFIKRFVRKFYNQSLCDITVLDNMYDHLSDEMIVRLYYKSNFHEFILDNKVIYDLFVEIGNTNIDFTDPNHVPDELVEYVDAIVQFMAEFVVYKYSFFRYEDRTKYHRRSAVVIMDTDSCFVTYGPTMEFLEEHLPSYIWDKKFTKESYRYRILNTLSCIVSRCVSDTLWNYLSVVNVPEEDRKFIKMKNEFYLSRLLITFAKKSYVGLRLRQEEVILNPPELDVKGVNFFKSTASKKTTEFIYNEILMSEILQSADGQIRTSRIHKKIQDYQDRMEEEIKKGDMDYLKRAIRVKTADAYKDPMRIGQYKAVFVWNAICDEKDRIELPSTVTLVKVKLKKKADIAKLEQWPDIYDKVMYLFKTVPEIGNPDFDWKDYYAFPEKEEKMKGINTIALPNEFDEVPDWLLAIIDVDTLISDNMKLFTQLYKPLGLVEGKSSVNGTSSDFFTNIIRI